MSTLEMVFWNVQHGSAAYIATPNDKKLVFDLGTGEIGDGNRPFSPLQRLRESYGVYQLDGVLVTHPHRDHIDDIFSFDMMSPIVFCRPRHLSEADIRGGNRPGDSHYIDKYLEIDRRYSTPVGAGSGSPDPFSASASGCDFFEMFTPRSCNRSNLNDHSIATVISYAGSKILIPGDNESCSWTELLANQAFRDAIRGTHIFVASHHGRESGYYAELFDYFKPKLTIISDGPSGSTSVTGNYINVSSGWPVYSRSGGPPETRYCLTTRCDGVIIVKFYYSGGQQVLNVTIS